MSLDDVRRHIITSPTQIGHVTSLHCQKYTKVITELLTSQSPIKPREERYSAPDELFLEIWPVTAPVT